MIDLNDVLLAASNIPVDDPIAEIWGRGLQSGYKIIEYTGSLPITINANGDTMLDYRIYGADGGVGEEVDITGLSEPLCGIQTYTDSLDLSTGILTRRIKKLVLTGNEAVQDYTPGNPVKYIINIPVSTAPLSEGFLGLCTHYFNGSAFTENNAFRIDLSNPHWYRKIVVRDGRFTEANELKAYIAAQYAAGTPVTFWYVLAEPDVSTIHVPSGLTGTIEGYLIQDGTPTPETPIYPTANGVKQADDTYSIPYGYKLPMTVSDGNTAQTVPVYIGENQLDAGEYVSYREQKVYKRTENLLNSKIIGVTQKVKIEPNTEYVLSRYAILGVNKIYWSVYSESDKNIYGEMFMQNDTAMRVPSLNNASYVMITIPEIAYDSVSIVKGTFINTRTAVPATYTPYVLPTDPPVPFPEIPTIDGETVIDYDGEPKPSQMYVKYKDKG